METYEGLDGRNTLIAALKEKYYTKSAESIILIQASRGQGKSYVINKLIDEISHKEFTVFLNYEDELRTTGICEKIKRLNAIGLSGGVAGVSIGFSVGWSNPSSQYEKIRSMLASYLKKDVLICVDNIENVSDELRFLVIQIIGNIKRLENDYSKKIFVLITSTLDIYNDNISKYDISKKIIICSQPGQR